jgi:L-seryl-tRNA(Ser) seleniumtransferase
VLFSGDKLLGGPQCGIVAGRRDLVVRLRRNPLKRALRVDKLVIAALEQVLRLYLHVERLPAELPTLRWLTRETGTIMPVALRLASALEASLPQTFVVEVVQCRSQIGSGALPVDLLSSAGVRISSRGARRDRDVQQLHRALRSLPLPLIGRLEDHALVLDCRCLDDADDAIGALDHLGGTLSRAGLAGRAPGR